jgi:hypothetical protein
MADAHAAEQSEASMHGLSALLLRVAHLKAAVYTGLQQTTQWAEANPSPSTASQMMAPLERGTGTGELESSHEAVESVSSALHNILSCVHVIEVECPAVVAAAVSHDFAPGIAANGYRSLLRVLRCALGNVQVSGAHRQWDERRGRGERERKGVETLERPCLSPL